MRESEFKNNLFPDCETKKKIENEMRKRGDGRWDDMIREKVRWDDDKMVDELKNDKPISEISSAAVILLNWINPGFSRIA